MQLNRNGYEPLRWAVVLTVLTIGWPATTAGTAKAPPVPEVATVTIASAAGRVDHRVAGPHIGLPRGGNPAAGQRHHQEAPVPEGSDVKAGELLYQIDPAPFQVAYDSAKASLGKAQANLPSIR